MEELKLIMETIKSLSGDASTAFIVWCLCKYIPFMIGMPLTFYAIAVGVRRSIHTGMKWKYTLARMEAKERSK